MMDQSAATGGAGNDDTEPDNSLSGARFRELIEGAPDAILEVNRDGRILLVNDEAERLFHCRREDLIGKLVEDFVPRRFRATHTLHRDHYHDRPTRRPMGSSLDLWAQRPDGSEFPVDIKLSPLQTEMEIRVMCVVRDITERRRVEEQIQLLNKDLEQQNREVERANRLKGEFLASVSHELRTPLNAIVGFSHLLGEQREGLNEEQKRFVGYISQGARHLLTLINDILDLSKIEAGRLELRAERVAIASVLEEVLVAVRPSAELKQLHLDSQVPSNLEIVADRTRFKQILFNLLSNAVKFTPIDGAVTIEAHVGDDGFQLRVSDTGIGIAPEEIDAIFEKFHQASATTKGIREGTGLGLAITKSLVELHGGRIWAESKVGSGSKFFVDLPVRGLMDH